LIRSVHGITLHPRPAFRYISGGKTQWRPG
jgi:hypothetical protein